MSTMLPKVVVIQTRLRADWEQRCNQSGLSKAKAATFAQDALLLPFTAEPVWAAVLYRDIETGPRQHKVFRFDSPIAYANFSDCLDKGFADGELANRHYRGPVETRLIGPDLVDKLRVVVANAVTQPGGRQPIEPWMWYSHFFAPGAIVDPYMDFLEGDSRTVTSRDDFTRMMMGYRAERVQGQTEDAQIARLVHEANELWDVSNLLGII